MGGGDARGLGTCAPMWIGCAAFSRCFDRWFGRGVEGGDAVVRVPWTYVLCAALNQRVYNFDLLPITIKVL